MGSLLAVGGAFLPFYAITTSVQNSFWAEGYDIAHWAARFAMIAPALVLVVSLAQYLARRGWLSVSRTPYLQLGAAALLLGASLGSMSVWWNAVEYLNGRYDPHAATVSLPIVGIEERGRPGRPPGYFLLVEDSQAPARRASYFWGPHYPTSWNRPGACLVGSSGPGALGLTWIGSRRIEQCPRNY